MADESQQIGQDEIERLLAEAQAAAGGDAGGNQPSAARPAAVAAPHPSAPPSGAARAAADSAISPSDIEALLNQADEALASIDRAEPDPLPEGVRTFQFRDFAGATANKQSATLELMRDVQLDLTIELGRTHMHLEDVLKLQQGAVVPLDKLAGDPADIYVNGRLIARGEILVLNDNFCVRVAELIAGEPR
jgi:flagellar motor switch protein FliN/FliY